MALFYRADARYEALLTTEPPADLALVYDEWRRDTGDPENERIYAVQVQARMRSLKQLDTFFAEQARQVSALEAEASHIADLSHHCGLRLAEASVPDSVQTPEQYSQHCGPIEQRAGAIRTRAIPAYQACLERSIELGVSNEFSRRCERQLERLARAELAPFAELLGLPTVTTSELSRVGVVADPSPYMVDAERRPELTHP